MTTRMHKAASRYLTDSNIEKIFTRMRCAFKQAVRWEIIGRNPFDNAILPRTNDKKREIWNADTIRQALDAYTESKLCIAMNLSFACSLRLGEILGLTWDNVHISDADIAADDAWIYIDKELTRATQRAIDMPGESVRAPQEQRNFFSSNRRRASATSPPCCFSSRKSRSSSAPWRR